MNIQQLKLNCGERLRNICVKLLDYFDDYTYPSDIACQKIYERRSKCMVGRLAASEK